MNKYVKAMMMSNGQSKDTEYRDNGDERNYKDHERKEHHKDAERPYSHEQAYMGDPHEMKLTREMADKWTAGMVNTDGTTGPHWSMEQAKQAMAQRGIECDPVEFYAALNAVYSDYCAVARKHNVNTIDFYADMAKAWLYDDDAVEDKAVAYYTYVAEH